MSQLRITKFFHPPSIEEIAAISPALAEFVKGERQLSDAKDRRTPVVLLRKPQKLSDLAKRRLTRDKLIEREDRKQRLRWIEAGL